MNTNNEQQSNNAGNKNGISLPSVSSQATVGTRATDMGDMEYKHPSSTPLPLPSIPAAGAGEKDGNGNVAIAIHHDPTSTPQVTPTAMSPVAVGSPATGATADGSLSSPTPLIRRESSQRTIDASLLANVEDRVIMAATSLTNGLATSQVSINREKYGANDVATPRQNPLLLFLSKFNNTSAWMLEIVVILAAVLGEYVNAVVIAVLLTFNAVMSFHHDLHARAAVEALKAKLNIQSRVLRDGKWSLVASQELVSGDVVRLRIGDVVPADVVITDGEGGIDQSSLTGETVLRQVRDHHKVFGGSTVKRGEFTSIVVATGERAAFGKTFFLIQNSKPTSHSDAVMVRVARSLFIMVGVTLAIAIFVLLGQHEYSKLVDVLPLLLVLMVSAIPVALPAMFTTTMALGSMELTRNGVIMSRLNAIEDAAGMSVLCSDKTGTITKNEISVKDVKPMSANVTSMRMLLVAALSSRAENQDPTDLAFLKGYAEKLAVPGTPRPSAHSPRAILGAATIDEAPQLILPPSIADAMHALSSPSTNTVTATSAAIHGGATGANANNNNNASVSIDINDEEPSSIPLPPVDALPVSSHDVYADMHGGVPKRQLSMLSTAAAALAEYHVMHFTPFDATIRRTEAIVEYDSPDGSGARMRFRAIKGSLNTLLSICDVGVMLNNEASQLADDYASKGFRTLAVACTTPIRIPVEQQTLTLSKDDLRRMRSQKPNFLGVIALHDPPRDTSAAIIAEIHSLGVEVMMLTGDATPVAKETASQVGLQPEKIIDVAHYRAAIRRAVTAEGKYKSGEELEAAVDARLWALPQLDVEHATGFAEIYPQDKHFVVNRLQKLGKIVGMTGDGVNDAPALKKAEVGVAVDNATDVAKGAASAVMTNEGLQGIPAMIRVGRRIHSRITTWVLNKTTRTFLTAGFVVLVFLYSGVFAVATFHMILMIFLVDFVTLSLASDNAHWSKVPDTWQINKLATVATIIGTICTGQMIGFYELCKYVFNPNEDELQTFAFMLMFQFAICNTFSFRERGHFYESLAAKPLLYTCIIESIGMIIVCSLGIPGAITSLHVGAVFMAAGAAIVLVFGVNDQIKRALLRKLGIH